MGKESKVRGTGYEYRIVSFFKNEKQKYNQPIGWDAERNSLSREEKSFGKTTAKHDVKAWKDLEDGRIFLQIEAKKTGSNVHTIQKGWIDKIDFFSDELLVIALQRTDHYAIVDVGVAPTLYGVENDEDVTIGEKFIEDMITHAEKKIKCRGLKSVRVHREDIEKATADTPVILNWENIDRTFLVIPLFQYVKLREQRPPNVRNDIQESYSETIPTVEVTCTGDSCDFNEEVIVCPRTGLPIKIRIYRK